MKNKNNEIERSAKKIMCLYKSFILNTLGLSGVLVINGGRVLNGYVKNNCSKYHYANVNCDKDLITVGIIINDPINITENDKDVSYLLSANASTTFLKTYKL